MNAVYCWFFFILQYQHLLSNFQCVFYEQAWTNPQPLGETFLTEI